MSQDAVKRQIIFGTTLGETKAHVLAAKERFTNVSDNLMMQAVLAEWYDLIGEDPEAINRVIESGKELWPELARSPGLILRKIAVEWHRDRFDPHRARVQDTLQRIEEKLDRLLTDRPE